MLILCNKLYLPPRRPGAVLVNPGVAPIFNGIFEMQNSTRNMEKIAKNGAWETGAPRVYHPRIYHDGALRETYGLLTRKEPAKLRPFLLRFAIFCRGHGAVSNWAYGMHLPGAGGRFRH
jgi:hypothetical protein